MTILGPQQEPQEVGDQAVLVPNQNEGQPEEEGPEVLTQDERKQAEVDSSESWTSSLVSFGSDAQTSRSRRKVYFSCAEAGM